MGTTASGDVEEEGQEVDRHTSLAVGFANSLSEKDREDPMLQDMLSWIITYMQPISMMTPRQMRASITAIANDIEVQLNAMYGFNIATTWQKTQVSENVDGSAADCDVYTILLDFYVVGITHEYKGTMH